MIVVISQPMLFPWVGMLEQVRLANCYVHYADVQFSKGSFVNRVQVKTETTMQWLTVPLRQLSLGQRIDEVWINEQRPWRREHLKLLGGAFAKAPFRDEMLGLVESVYQQDYANIGELSESSLMALCRYYGLDAGRRFLQSGAMGIKGSGSRRVLDTVLALGGDTYVTGHGARKYLDHQAFERAGVRVEYMDYAKVPYPQLHGAFTPYVSALDLLANRGRDGIEYIRSGTVYWKDFLDDGSDRQVSA